MAKLEEAVARGMRRGRPILILGPDRDAGDLHDQLTRLAAGLRVHFCDCRSTVPARPELIERFKNGLTDAGILHVAVARALDPDLFDTIVSVICDDRLPGHDRDDPRLDGLLVVSANVRFSSELDVQPALRELFPIVVGAAE